MARLAGPSDADLASIYAESSFSGFGNMVAAKPVFIADVAGTAENIRIPINDMGGDANIRVHLYKIPGNTGNAQLVGTANTASAGSPLTLPLTIVGDASVAVGDAFFIVMGGDVSSVDGGQFFRAAYDAGQVQAADVGQTSFAGSFYASPSASLDYSLYSTIADGVYWFQVDGTAGVSTDLRARVTMRTPANALVADQNWIVEITEPEVGGAVLVPVQTLGSVSGIIEGDSQLLGVVDDTVWFIVRDEDESDPNIAGKIYPAIVFDANA